MTKKFELTAESKVVYGRTLYQIKALISFSNVAKDDLGGWIEKEDNLAQSGEAWVFDEACVFDEARVYGKALVFDEACVFDEARVYDEACVYGKAGVFDEACVYGEARVYGKAWVFDEACVYGKARVYGKAWVFDEACVFDEARVYGAMKLTVKFPNPDDKWVGFSFTYGSFTVTIQSNGIAIIGCGETKTIKEWLKTSEDEVVRKGLPRWAYATYQATLKLIQSDIEQGK